MIPWGFVWYSTKGGAGKSTHTAHHAVLSAQAGWRVLVVDEDPQGNQRRLLGYSEREEYDGGEGFANAASSRKPPPVIRDVRRYKQGVVDVVPGGRHLSRLESVFDDEIRAGDPTLLTEMLEPIARDYDLILFDLPAKPSPMHTMTLATAHYMMMPVGPADETHLDGINGAVALYDRQRKVFNPDLELFGIVIGPWDSRSNELTDIKSRIHERVIGKVPIIGPPTRLCPGVARDLVRLGLTAPELDRLAKDSRNKRIAWLRRRKQAGEGFDEPSPETYKDAGRLASDYISLIKAVNTKFLQRQEVYEKKLAGEKG